MHRHPREIAKEIREQRSEVMDRETKRFEAARDVCARLAANPTVHMPPHSIAFEAVVQADALLAELDRTADKGTAYQTVRLNDEFATTVDEWVAALKIIQPTHPIIAEVAELRRKADLWGVMENKSIVISSIGNGWYGTVSGQRAGLLHTGTLLELAEKIQREGGE